jgi:hypothetical protein
MKPEEILQHLKEQHENYDPNWKGTCTYSESFVIEAIKYAISISKRKIKGQP